jgi:hypothetical protein
MQLLDDHLLRLYKEGKIERSDVMQRCRYPDEVSNALMQMEQNATAS